MAFLMLRLTFLLTVVVSADPLCANVVSHRLRWLLLRSSCCCLPGYSGQDFLSLRGGGHGDFNLDNIPATTLAKLTRLSGDEDASEALQGELDVLNNQSCASNCTTEGHAPLPSHNTTGQDSNSTQKVHAPEEGMGGNGTGGDVVGGRDIQQHQESENVRLWHVCKRGDDAMAAREVAVLVQIGAEVVCRDEALEDTHKGSLLHCAAERNMPETIRALIKVGADVNERDESGSTPLHCATRRGNIESVRVLIDEGDADVECKDGAGLDAWAITEKEGHKRLGLFILARVTAKEIERESEEMHAREAPANTSTRTAVWNDSMVLPGSDSHRLTEDGERQGKRRASEMRELDSMQSVDPELFESSSSSDVPFGMPHGSKKPRRTDIAPLDFEKYLEHSSEAEREAVMEAAKHGPGWREPPPSLTPLSNFSADSGSSLETPKQSDSANIIRERSSEKDSEDSDPNYSVKTSDLITSSSSHFKNLNKPAYVKSDSTETEESGTAKVIRAHREGRDPDDAWLDHLEGHDNRDKDSSPSSETLYDIPYKDSRPPGLRESDDDDSDD